MEIIIVRRMSSPEGRKKKGGKDGKGEGERKGKKRREREKEKERKRKKYPCLLENDRLDKASLQRTQLRHLSLSVSHLQFIL